MATYNYLARDSNGRITRGSQDSASVSTLRNFLQSRGLKLMSVEEVPIASWNLQTLIGYLNPFQWLPPRSLDIEIALEQLAVMLRSGLSLLEALKTVAQQARFQPLRRVCESVAESIQEGQSFADALAEHKSIPMVVVQLVRVGEATGNLDLVLDRAASQIRTRRQNINSLITALAYPAFVAVAAIAVAIYLIVVVIPELQKFLSAMGKRLPRMTQRLLDVAEWVQVNGVSTVVFIAIVLLTVVLVYLWPPGRYQIDRFLLRIPVIGYVLRLSGTVTFSSSLSVMVRSGITVLDALRTVEQLHGNRFLASRVAAARDAVIQGEALSEPLAVRYAHMPMLASMVAVAESTGQMDEVLDSVARFHESQLQSAIKRLSALVEPAVIVVVGGIVGYVYMAFFVALFSAGGNLQ